MSTTKGNSRTVIKVYLMIATLVGLIGLLIGYGELAHSGLQYLIIGDQEYIISRSYEIERCEDLNYAINKEGTVRSPIEITNCKQEKESELIMRRKVEFKEDLISGIVWGTLFLIVFLLHYPRFLRENK